MTRVQMSDPSEIHKKADELADLIGPISTKKDRARIIREWMYRQIPEIDIRELLFE